MLLQMTHASETISTHQLGSSETLRESQGDGHYCMYLNWPFADRID